MTSAYRAEHAPRSNISDWRDRAACRAHDGELWFPVSSHPDAYEEPRRICGACPVIDDCREWALDARVGHGMWGGLTADELDTERQRRVAPDRAST